MSPVAPVLVLSSQPSPLATDLASHFGTRAAFFEAATFESIDPAARWAAVVLDVEGELAADALPRLRRTLPATPALAVLGALGARTINLAHRHHVEVLARPAPREALIAFMERALVAAPGLTREDISMWTKVLVLRYGLTNREADLFDHVLEHESRADVAARWRAPQEVVHAELLSLLRKCEARNAESLAKSVLVNAVLYRVDPSLARHQTHGRADDEDDEREAAACHA